MQKFSLFSRSLLLIATFLTSTVVTAQSEHIKIDARNTGQVVSSYMFGANFVYDANTLVQLDKSQSVMRNWSIRYPGGSVAENRFNPNNPFYYYDNGAQVNTNRDIRNYISRVNQYNWYAVFVIPTERYATNVSLGYTEIERYVRRLLKGEFGQIEAGRIIQFEIGNEFYWNDADITAEQYGKVASRLVDAIHAGIANSGKASTYHTRVSVQSGVNVADARAVAPYFKNQGNKINNLTFHWYPGRAEIQLGMWQFDGVNQKFSQRLNSIANEWRQHAGFTKPFYLSEYNITHRSNGVDVGLRNPLGLMTIFAESVRANTQMAAVWPLFGWRESLRTDFFRTDSGGVVEPTTNALFYKWLGNNTRGSRIIRSVSNSSYSNASNFRNGIYVEAFRRGSDTMIVYAFGMEAAKEAVRLEFANFTISSVHAEKLYTARGKESDPTVVANKARIWPSIWGTQRNNSTFTINSNSQYEVVKLVLKGTFQ